MDGGKISKLNAKLAEISNQIDEADSRKAKALAVKVDLINQVEKLKNDLNV